ncbi:response regulator [Spirosoma sp. HMF4905]|uniref:Response regulator n=1 Tax=Spirosoma arboris TaxID=2682092 RepID=A0A7K1S5H0_9BACT|nr:response regulator [Spirosoma arboris]MVM28858.1 response regulator [Spirosoma arboris]
MPLQTNLFYEVFLVDDDEEDGYLLLNAFQSYSDQINLRQFTDSASLLASLETAQTLPSLLLLDMHMPGMNGLEVLSWLNQHQWYTRIPVVIWSGWLAEEETNQCYEAGASSVILKSTDYASLRRTITSLCDYWFGAVQLPSSVRSSGH